MVTVKVTWCTSGTSVLALLLALDLLPADDTVTKLVALGFLLRPDLVLLGRAADDLLLIAVPSFSLV